MGTFFYLEGAYLVLAGIILAVTLFVTTRPFMSDGAVKKGMLSVSFVLAFMIGSHYLLTTGRMAEVKAAFAEGKTILCESRMQRKVSQVVRVNRANDWRLKGDEFVSKHYERPFFSARCIVE